MADPKSWNGAEARASALSSVASPAASNNGPFEFSEKGTVAKNAPVPDGEADDDPTASGGPAASEPSSDLWSTEFSQPLGSGAPVSPLNSVRPSRQVAATFVQPIDNPGESDSRDLIAQPDPAGAAAPLPPFLKTRNGKIAASVIAVLSVLLVSLGLVWFWSSEGSASRSSSENGDGNRSGDGGNGGGTNGVDGITSGVTHRHSADIGFTRMHLAGFDVALMTYNGVIPGPTMVVSPGSTLELTLTNKLPANRVVPARLAAMNATERFAACWPPMAVGGPGGTTVSNGGLPSRRQLRSLQMTPMPMDHSSHEGMGGSTTTKSPLDYVNNPHSFRTTNIHTHGLQVPSSEDNPFVSVAPEGGQTKQSYHIPSDHPSGLFWYHPHTHGSAVVQLANGMSGLIKVVGSFDAAMAQKGYKEVTLTVQQLDLVKLDAGSLGDVAKVTGTSTPLSGSVSSTVYGFDPIPFVCASDGGFTRGPFDLNLIMVEGAVSGYSQSTATSGNTGGMNPTMNMGSHAEAHVLPEWTHTGRHPTHTIEYGEIMWLRVLNAHSRQPLVLGFDTLSTSAVASAKDPAPYSSLSSALLASALELYLVAVDGLSLEKPVKIDLPKGGLPFAWGQDVENGVLLPPGGRYDLLLKAPLSASAASSAVSKASSDAVSSGKVTSFELSGATSRPASSVTLWSHRYVGCDDKPDCHRYPPFKVATFVLQPTSGSARRLDKKKKKDDDDNDNTSSGSSSSSSGSTIAGPASPAPRLPMSLPSVLPAPATTASASSSSASSATATRRLAHIEPNEVTRKRVFVLSQHIEPGSAYPDAEELASRAPANHNRDPLSLTNTGYYINNRTYDPGRVDFTAVQGTAEEWWIENPAPAQDHPWHVHTHPFEVVGLYELDDEEAEKKGQAARNLLAQPYWCDTIWVPEGMRAITRIRFAGGSRYAGRSIAHCHIAEHESAGMMVQYDVVNPA